MTSATEVTVRLLADTPHESYEVGVEYPGMGGMAFRREEDGSFSCARCGAGGLRSPNGVQTHFNFHCPEHPKRAQIDHSREKARADPTVGPTVRSKRGLRRQGIDRPPTVLEEIRDRPGGMLGGPAAYFIRLDGATIREALVINPNGAEVVRNGTDRAGARYVRERMKARGMEYVGPTLTLAGVRRLVEVIRGNRYDYLLDLKEQIADCEQTIHNSDRPDVRDNAKKRRNQLERLVAQANRDVEPEEVVREMDDILKAMKLAALSPAQREAITIMMGGEVDARIQGLIARMERKGVQGTFGGQGDEGGQTFGASVTNAPADADF